MSRTKVRKQVSAADRRRELEEQGIAVCFASNRGLVEEAPLAYKEVDKVVAVVERVGLAGRLARLQPIGVIRDDRLGSPSRPTGGGLTDYE